jgi:starch-binding outer membrane protein, SusD/RagB family
LVLKLNYNFLKNCFMQRNYKVYILALACIALSITSCKKFVDVGAPPTSTNGVNVYATDANAVAVLSGLHVQLSGFAQGNRSVSFLAGLSSDEFALMSGADATFNGYYTNTLTVIASSSIGTDFWNVLYDYVYTANSAIEGLNKTASLTSAVRQQLLGESKFFRAFVYFYLVNLFGDVPLVISTDFSKSASLPRTPKAQVYIQIIKDLEEAQELLSEDYLNGNLKPYTSSSNERVRPTKWAARALLARVYLYNNDWIKAEEQSSLVINNQFLFDVIPLNEVFLKNSKEAIWQLQPVAAGYNTEDAKLFSLTSSGLNSTNPVKLSDYVLSAFDSSDKRKIIGNWINNVTVNAEELFYPFKYKQSQNNPSITTESGTQNMSEYLMVLRLGEQYLIRAEARAQQNKISEAQADLNVIRNRAGLSSTTADTKPSLITAILNERRLELFSEWGHRWFDLKRTSIINSVMDTVTPAKSNGSQWQSFQQLYPIPFQELQLNAALVQNSGY